LILYGSPEGAKQLASMLKRRLTMNILGALEAALNRVLAREDLVSAKTEFFQIAFVPCANFDRNPAVIANFPKSPADIRPVDSLRPSVLGIELRMICSGLEALDMNFDEPLADGSNPVLRKAVGDYIADVEVGPDPGAVELIDIPDEFERAQQKSVSHVLDRDDDLELLSERNL
jgi:hypothetical protein